MKSKSYRKSPPRKPLKAAALALLPVAAQVVHHVATELPQLLAAAVVDVGSGRSLAVHANDSGINPATAATHHAEVVKQKQKAMSALKLQGETIEDILITLSSQVHVLQLSPDGRWFVYLVVPAHDTNLGLVREVLRAQARLLRAPAAQ